MTNGKCLKCNHTCGKLDRTGCYDLQLYVKLVEDDGYAQNIQGSGLTHHLKLILKCPNDRVISYSNLTYNGGSWVGDLDLTGIEPGWDGSDPLEPDYVHVELIYTDVGTGPGFNTSTINGPVENPATRLPRRHLFGTLTFSGSEDFMRVRGDVFINADRTVRLYTETASQTFTRNKYRLHVWGQHADVGQHELRMQGVYRAYFYTIINPTPSSSGGQIYNGYRDCPFDAVRVVAKNASTNTILNTMRLLFSDINSQIYGYVTNNPSGIGGSFGLPVYNNNPMHLLRRDYNLEEVYIRQDFSSATFKELNISGMDVYEETWNTNTALNGSGTTNGGYTPIPVGDRLPKFPQMKKYKISDLLPDVERFKFSINGRESNPVIISKTRPNYIPYQYSGVYHYDSNFNWVEDILDNPDCLVDKGSSERFFHLSGPDPYKSLPGYDYYGSVYSYTQWLCNFTTTGITSVPDNGKPTGFLDFTHEFSLSGIGEKDPVIMITDDSKMLNYQVTVEKVEPTFNWWTGKYATKKWLGKIPRLFYQPPKKYTVKIENLEGVYSKGNGTFTIERNRLTCDYDYFYINPNITDNLDLIGIYFQNMWAGYSGYNAYAQMYLYFRVDYSEANGHKFYVGKPQLVQSDGTEPPPGVFGLYPVGYQYSNHYGNGSYYINPKSKYIYKNGVYYGYIPQPSLQIGYTYHPEFSAWTAVMPQLSDRYGEHIYDYTHITDGPAPRVTVTFLE